jgi:hypothetical protein
MGFWYWHGSKLAKGKFQSDISLQQPEPFAK